MTRMMAVAALAVMTAGSAHALGIVPGGPVSATFHEDFGVFTGSGTQLDGGACDYDSVSGCDMQTDDGGTFLYGFDWVDEDTFAIALVDDAFSSGPEDIVVTATVSLMSDILSIVEAPGDILGFLFDPIDNDTSPITSLATSTIGFTTTAGGATIEVALEGIDELFYPDGGYVIEYDVTFADAQPGVVPLPASALLLLGAVAAIAPFRRRRR
jgi:hypothetical protein